MMFSRKKQITKKMTLAGFSQRGSQFAVIRLDVIDAYDHQVVLLYTFPRCVFEYNLRGMWESN